jgi:ASC-1-like (ASCH) protein
MGVYLKKEAFDEILKGDKLYELRLFKSLFKSVSVGDNLVIRDSKRELNCNVEEIHKFDTLEQVFNVLNYNDFNSRTNTIEETINLYKSIYPKIELPILVFKLKKVK